MEKNIKVKVTKMVVISAYSEDYSEKSYKFYYGQNNYEYVPKSQVKFVEHSNGTLEFGSQIHSRYFEMPLWLYSKLKGIEYYGF